MERELPLFDGPRSRRADPITSQMAEEKTAPTVSHQRRVVLDLVKANPDSTSAEIARFGGLDRHTPGRRLNELVKLGLVEVTGRRACSTNGNQMQTYILTKPS